MKNIYTITILLLSIINMSVSKLSCAMQDPLMQRAITTPQSRRTRSTQIELTNNATIRRQTNLDGLTTQIINLKNQIDEIESDEEILLQDKRNTYRHLKRLESLQYAQRIRPDRDDFKHRDDNKSCCMLVFYSAQSVAKESFCCSDQKDNSLAVLKCRKKFFDASLGTSLLCTGFLLASAENRNHTCSAISCTCATLCSCVMCCCSHRQD